jgi:hypothetical protein
MNNGLSRITGKMQGIRTDIMVGTMLKTKNLFKMNRFLCLAGATGFAPSASKFGGQTFRPDWGLKDCRMALFAF